MNFSYSEEQTLIADSLGKLLEDTCSAASRKHLLAGDRTSDPALWHALCDMGLTGLPVPEGFGGIGGTAVDSMIVATEFGRHLAMEPFTASVVAGSAALKLAGSQDQKQALLPRIADGSVKLAAAFLEPGGRFDLAHVGTSATATADGYRLTGHKSAVLAGPGADMLIVSARTAGDDRRAEDGLSLFLIEANAPGVTVKRYRLVDGRPGAEIVLEGAAVPAAALLGQEGAAFPVIEHVADLTTAAMCAEALGALEKIVAMTTGYLTMRQQFGQPISRFQALRHQIAEMVIDLEHARSLVLEAAMTADSPDAPARRRAVSAAKVYLAEKGRLICQKAIQMHGGIGVTEEYELGDYVKRAMVAELAFGDGDHHLERFAANR